MARTPIAKPLALGLTILALGCLSSAARAQCYGLWVQAELGAQYDHAMTYDSLRGRVIMHCVAPGAGASAGTWAWDGVKWTLLAWDGPWPLRTAFRIAYDAGRDRVVLFGGQDVGTSASLRDTWEFDGSRWRLVASDGPPAESDGVLVYHAGRGTVMLLGRSSNGLWEWDGVRWQQVPGSPPPLGAFSAPLMVYDSLRDRLVCLPNPQSASGGTFVFAGNQWTQLTTPSPISANGHALAYDSLRDRVVLMGGGFNSQCCPGDNTWSEFNGTSWTAPANAMPERSGEAMVYDAARHTCVLFGGGSSCRPLTPYFHETWEWNGAAWTLWPDPRPIVRDGAAVEYHAARGKLVVFGGRRSFFCCNSEGCPDQRLSDTWEWGPTGWTLIQAEMFGRDRATDSMAYDAANARTIISGRNYLLGGGISPELTLAYDGAWTNLQTAANTNQAANAVAYDPGRSRVVLFGGLANGNPGVDVYELMSNVWTFITTNSAVPVYGRPAFDTVRQELIHFGGRIGNIPHNDTWTWDGSEWTQLSLPPPLPAGRILHAIASDPQRGVVLMTGGSGSSPTYTDTWEWNSFQWTQVGAGGPAGTWGSAFYDIASAAVGLFYRNSIWHWMPAQAPVFVESPHDTDAIVGNTAMLECTTEQVGPVTFQWRKNGVPVVDDGRIRGSHTMRLVFEQATLDDTGAYDVVCTSGCGAVTSETASLVVFCPADYNQDGFVDGIDYDNFNNDFESSDPDQQMRADFNGDGFVDGIDYDLFMNAFETPC